MARPALTVDEVMVILPDTPQRIATLTDGLRTATVDEFGSTVERSALFFGDRLAGHEQVHLTQVEDVAGRVRP